MLANGLRAHGNDATREVLRHDNGVATDDAEGLFGRL